MPLEFRFMTVIAIELGPRYVIPKDQCDQMAKLSLQFLVLHNNGTR